MSGPVLTTAELIRRTTFPLAAASMAVGVWLSTRPEALADFEQVLDWTRHVAQHQSPYGPSSVTDYPPWALVTLLPLTWVPPSVAPSVWIGFNLLLAITVALMLVRPIDEEPAAVRASLAALVLSASCFRVLGQFSLLSFALALAGTQARNVLAGGALLGLGLMKPHVGGTLWLAHLLLGDWRRAGVASLVPLALLMLTALTLDTSPVSLLGDYARALEAAQGGRDVFPGHTDLETWLAPVFPGVTTVWGTGVVFGVLVAPIAVAAARLKDQISRRVTLQLELYAWCGVASLLATRHLSYDFLLILPIVIVWRVRPGSSNPIGQPWRTAWMVTVGLLVVQVPGWWRRFAADLGLEELSFVLELDRLLCLALYGLLMWRFIRLNMTE